MKTGLIVLKGFELVYVYTTDKGRRVTSFNVPRGKMYDEHSEERYTLFGVFLYDRKKLEARTATRFRARPYIEPYGDEFGDIGTPEGFVLMREMKYVKFNMRRDYVATDKMLSVNNKDARTSFIQRRRDAYKRKLRAIHNKMKELMELGVERTAAIKAAKKCGCSH